MPSPPLAARLADRYMLATQVFAALLTDHLTRPATNPLLPARAASKSRAIAVELDLSTAKPPCLNLSRHVLAADYLPTLSHSAWELLVDGRTATGRSLRSSRAATPTEFRYIAQPAHTDFPGVQPGTHTFAALQVAFSGMRNDPNVCRN
jgi:hypothetical protein